MVPYNSPAFILLLPSFSILDNSKSYEDMSTVLKKFCLPSIFHVSYGAQKLVSDTKLRKEKNISKIT